MKCILYGESSKFKKRTVKCMNLTNFHAYISITAFHWAFSFVMKSIQNFYSTKMVIDLSDPSYFGSNRYF